MWHNHQMHEHIEIINSLCVSKYDVHHMVQRAGISAAQWVSVRLYSAGLDESGHFIHWDAQEMNSGINV